MAWHTQNVQQVLHQWHTSLESGLDSRQVPALRVRFGKNKLTPPKQDGPLKLFFLQFHQPLVYILLVSSALLFLLQEWVDAGVVLGVTILNALIGFVQERKATDAIAALARRMENSVDVLRDGSFQRVAASELVCGDIVRVRAGDKVGADVRLASESELRLDESALTGESLPVEKQVEVLPLRTVVADRSNMLYAGSLVVAGSGTGVVVAVGEATELGKISKLMKDTVVLETPLVRKMARFSKGLLVVILALAGATFLIGLAQGVSWTVMFMRVVALAVGAIPEGLPAAMTITLAIGVNRMAQRRAIIRKLPAVEALGSTTVICTDKTGTLTENAMRVVHSWVPGRLYDWTGKGYNPEGSCSHNGQHVDASAEPALKEALVLGRMCNDAKLLPEEGAWSILGDPTEAALLTAAQKGLGQTAPHYADERVAALPFSSERRFMLTQHRLLSAPERSVLCIKGSVERVLEYCENQWGAEGEAQALDKAGVEAQAEQFAAQGLRVIAVARREIATESVANIEESLCGFTFIGLHALMDPPRAEVKTAIANCLNAGIEVKMITGDHKITAGSIAKAVGLTRGAEPSVLDGEALELLSEAELREAVKTTQVFARVVPEQKLLLVQALQANGHIVAMTGDGVNDAPALRRADIGIAMGITGTDVSKEAADMVLTDDNFVSIEAAIEEGRNVFENLVKFIVWTLPTNIGLGLVILAAVLLERMLPILPVQILWINMTTAVFLGLMLSFEAREPEIMLRKPRNPNAHILSRLVLFRIFFVGVLLLAGSFGLFEWALSRGFGDGVARTVAVNVFVVSSMWYLLNCRSLDHSMFRIGVFSNPWLWAGMGLMLLLQLLFTYHPWMNLWFHSAPMPIALWWPITGFGFVLYCIIGFEKLCCRLWLRRRRHAAG